MPPRSMGANPRPPIGPATPDAALRRAQGVFLALTIGLLLGGGMLAFLGLSRAGAVPLQPAPTPAAGGNGTGVDIFPVIVPIIGAIGLAVVVLAPRWMLRAAQTQWESRADDDAALTRVYGGFITLSTLQAAMLEGPGLLGAAAANITGNWLYLAAPLAAVVFLALLFPRTSRIHRWIDEVTGQPPTTSGAANQRQVADEEAA
ncbi:MAG: hypothetical protein QM783_04840 [Phycisphaerales bacterium]